LGLYGGEESVKTLNIGFTGTQKGMTDFQCLTVGNFLRIYEREPTELWFLQGDCIGADHEASFMAYGMGYKIWTFPPIHSSKRAWMKSDRMETPREYLTRNHNIVKACDMLVAAPAEDTEVLRSGTWATIRYAKKLDVHTFIVYPDHT
jgi:hypothetical protein